MTTKATHTFGDIVNRVSDSCRSDTEVTATVAHLLNSGRIRLNGEWGGKRVVVRPSLESFLHRVRPHS